jgi:hypothetical protein
VLTTSMRAPSSLTVVVQSHSSPARAPRTNLKRVVISRRSVRQVRLSGGGEVRSGGCFAIAHHVRHTQPDVTFVMCMRHALTSGSAKENI